MFIAFMSKIDLDYLAVCHLICLITIFSSTYYFYQFMKEDNINTRARLPLATIVQGLFYLLYFTTLAIKPYIVPKAIDKNKAMIHNNVSTGMVVVQFALTIILYGYFWRVCLRFTKQEIIDEWIHY